MTTAQECGLWEFKLFRSIVVCPGCQTKNRLAFGKPRPACGKCKGSLAEAKAISPKIHQTTLVQVEGPDGDRFTRLAVEGRQCFTNRLFEAGVRSYQEAIQLAFEGQFRDRAPVDAMLEEIYFLKGLCAYLSGAYKEAYRTFKAGLQSLRFVPEAYLFLLAALERTDMLPQETSFLKKAFGADLPPSVRKALAPRFEYEGDPASEANVRRFYELFFRDDPLLSKATL